MRDLQRSLRSSLPSGDEQVIITDKGFPTHIISPIQSVNFLASGMSPIEFNSSNILDGITTSASVEINKNKHNHGKK